MNKINEFSVCVCVCVCVCVRACVCVPGHNVYNNNLNFHPAILLLSVMHNAKLDNQLCLYSPRLCV